MQKTKDSRRRYGISKPEQRGREQSQIVIVDLFGISTAGICNLLVTKKEGAEGGHAKHYLIQSPQKRFRTLTCTVLVRARALSAVCMRIPIIMHRTDVTEIMGNIIQWTFIMMDCS